jgi:hypothetical protein
MCRLRAIRRRGHRHRSDQSTLSCPSISK